MGAAGSTLLFLRSVLWTILVPGVVAGYVPWRYFGLRQATLDVGNPLHLSGIAAIAAGSGVLGACIWHFATIGRGTLSPFDPTRKLVVQGLYRYVRNPMYLSVSTILLGEVLLVGSRDLLLYWAGWLGVVNLVVLVLEEPMLASRFGEEYREYRSRVPRWIPRSPRSQG